MFRLRRISEKPILAPIAQHEWEREAVLNCGVVRHEGLFHMVYRASDRPFGDFTRKYVTRFGYAVSRNGVDFTRLDKPVFEDDDPWAEWGVEDPRIVRMNDRFYATYSTWDGNMQHVRARLATTENFIVWRRHGVLLDEPNKNAALFPERIGGRYALLHRREPDIWLCFSEDLRKWSEHERIMQPRPGKWDGVKIGAAGPPVKHPEGWLLVYHGVDEKKVYRLGAALLDADNPTKVIARLDEPILEPELEWEIKGQVPNVVFSCATVDVGDSYYVYYGAADTVIALATVEKEAVRF
ncbi:MAG: glycosidase [bacterium]|nr:glycosidase [bacterium]